MPAPDRDGMAMQGAQTLPLLLSRRPPRTLTHPTHSLCAGLLALLEVRSPYSVLSTTYSALPSLPVALRMMQRDERVRRHGPVGAMAESPELPKEVRRRLVV